MLRVFYLLLGTLKRNTFAAGCGTGLVIIPSKTTNDNAVCSHKLKETTLLLFSLLLLVWWCLLFFQLQLLLGFLILLLFKTV